MIWAIVPVKPLLLGKSRLAGAVPLQARALMNRMLLEHTLEILRDTAGIAQTMVVSRDPEALAIAREFDARTLLEQGNSHLNMALERATAVTRAYRARGVLVLPADLPLLTAEDLEIILRLAIPAPVVVLAPDRHEAGTNAMLISPPGQIAFSFGSPSFPEHCRSAEAAGVRLEIVRRPTLALDLDYPEDLALLQELQSGSPLPLAARTKSPAEQPATPEETR
jgi:2-phospho-L-lactate guanylyltransferase